ncbi:hypothetical protein OIF97_07885 [Neisseria meningitidis]|uniref:hypothetical protein n=1 Tax=Neisseria meningitidis TaxID=487 RepID=UPI000315CE58|nr:hypothetical protein [Neisseria meningitidis]MCV6710490.1 hypothetical protein [Neisseria meningitidis]MCV6712638.1 hypothetical protein [Neisseria meningitidis]
MRQQKIPVNHARGIIFNFPIRFRPLIRHRPLHLQQCLVIQNRGRIRPIGGRNTCRTPNNQKTVSEIQHTLSFTFLANTPPKHVKPSEKQAETRENRLCRLKAGRQKTAARFSKGGFHIYSGLTKIRTRRRSRRQYK